MDQSLGDAAMNVNEHETFMSVGIRYLVVVVRIRFALFFALYYLNENWPEANSVVTNRNFVESSLNEMSAFHFNIQMHPKKPTSFNFFFNSHLSHLISD